MVLAEFWRGIKPYKRWFWACIAAFAATQILGIVVPLFYKKFFDLLGLAGTTAGDLIGIIVIIAAIHAAAWASYSFAYFSVNVVETRVMAKLKQNAFDYLMLHSQQFFANNFTGSLVQRVNRFSLAFESLMDILVFNLVPTAIAVLGAIIITAFIAPLVSLIIAVWTIFTLVFDFVFSSWKIKYIVDAAAADSKTTGTLSDDIVNHNSIALYNGYRGESANFKNVSDDQADKTLFSWHLSNYSNSIQQFFIYAVEFAAFYYAIVLWQNGQAMIGTFVLIQAYIIGIANQLWPLNRAFRGIYRSMADSKEMVEIMALPHEVKNIAGAKDLQNVKGGIEFKDITFSFRETRRVLKNLSLSIKAGEKVALVGPSGTGKTTLVGLLLRLFDPAAGAIFIDRTDIHRVTLESLRQSISLVPQDPALFHRTIMENIRYGRPSATDEEVVAAAKLAHCDKFVEKMPQKYETFVGERGVKLSGGERQRVAIARAILKNAPILILDEATSSLDSQSEKMIQDALNRLMAKCTTIAIAHRLSTIRKMDRIVVMENGAIAEQGTHPSLLRKRGGIYKNLWKLQAGGFIK